MTFKRWSETNPEVLKELKPDFGFRSWAKLSVDSKEIIWKNLEDYFFDKSIKIDNHTLKSYFPFSGSYSEQNLKKERVIKSIVKLNSYYKVKSYGENYLKDSSEYNACLDFYRIFILKAENVVLELLSIYCQAMIEERIEGQPKVIENEPDENFKKRKNTWQWKPFDDFASSLNEVFSHFGLNVHLTRLGFVPRQEDLIVQDIYDPVLKALSHPQWTEVNTLLSDAFLEYRANTPQGFSNSVTNAVASVQAFLQILVHGKTGKGEIKDLTRDARKASLIPNDSFTEKVFKELEAVFMRERQETSIAHPKKEYATDKNARLVLNLTMVFLQHCIQN